MESKPSVTVSGIPANRTNGNNLSQEKEKEKTMIVDGKQVAGAGTTAMSIIALAAAGIDYLTKNNINLFGGGNGGPAAAALAQAEAKIAKLEAEKYTDAAVLASGQRAAALEAQIAALTSTVGNLQQVVTGVTKYGVPASSIIGSTSASGTGA